MSLCPGVDPPFLALGDSCNFSHQLLPINIATLSFLSLKSQNIARDLCLILAKEVNTVQCFSTDLCPLEFESRTNLNAKVDSGCSFYQHERLLVEAFTDWV